MKFRTTDLLATCGAAGILIASFLAFATTNNGSAYVSIVHMSPIFYLLPVLGLGALALAIVAMMRKVTAPPASIALGAILLLLSVYTGFQATSQLESFVYSQYQFQAERARFNAEFDSFGNGTTPMPVVKQKSIVIDDADKVTLGIGFYLSALASLLIIGSGALMAKRGPAE